MTRQSHNLAVKFTNLLPDDIARAQLEDFIEG